MIHTEPAMTRPTIRAPKASASDIVGVVRAGGDVQEEDEMHAHLGDRERRERHQHARSVEERACRSRPRTMRR